MAEGESALKRQRSISGSDDVDTDRPSKKKAISPSSPFASEPSSSSASDSVEQEKPDMSAEILDDLEAELGCACCAGLLYRPAILQPCNHTFCASCIHLWVRNGGTACPTCRSPSDSIHQARFLQGMIDLLLRYRPEVERSAKEREEADATWMPGQLLPLPPARPRHQSPPPLPFNIARPCPHCTRNNGLGYVCPVPIPDPHQLPPDQAWDLETRGAPQGHAFCYGCDELYAVGAPTSMSCSFCRNKYCGYSVQATCVLPRIGMPQMPRNMDTIAKLLECNALYEAFTHNSIEVDLLIDYLHTRPGGVNGVLRSILDYVKSQPEGLGALSFLGMEGPVGDQTQHNGQDPDDMSEHDSDSEDEEGEPEVDDGYDHPRTPPPYVGPLEPMPDHLVPELHGHDEPAPPPTSSNPASEANVPEAQHEASSDMDVDDSFAAPGTTPAVRVTAPIATMVANPISAPPVPSIPTPQARTLYFTRICRNCARDVFVWGVFDWWMRERQAVPAAVPVDVRAKPHCPSGRRCPDQMDVSHAKECNHMCEPAPRARTPGGTEIPSIWELPPQPYTGPLGPETPPPFTEDLAPAPPPPSFTGELEVPRTPPFTDDITIVAAPLPPMPSSDPAEQIVEEMLLPPLPTSLALPILHAQDINMDDEAEVERQMEQYLNLEVGVTAAV